MTTPEAEATFAAIVEALGKKRLIAFVGAGVSASVGYPTWNRLLTRLHQTVMKLPAAPASPKYILQLRRMKDSLWRAEEYRRLLGRAGFEAVLWESFRPIDRSSPALQALVALPFRHFLTTNYDDSLETALRSRPEQGSRGTRLEVIDWADNERLSHFLASLSTPDGPQHLVYLHGRYGEPGSTVLTESDYVRRYVVSDDAGRKLFALLITQPVLFIGFSLEDPELAYILRHVQARLAAGVTQHFAILPSPGGSEQEAAYKGYYAKKYGVQALFYPTTDNHAALADILRALGTQSTVKPSTPARGGGLKRRVSVARTAALTSSSRRKDPDDPNKGNFGGLSRRNGWSVDATVKATPDPDWFDVVIVVTAPTGGQRRRYEGASVTVHLHPTFTPDRIHVTVEDGKAVVERQAYGAFTVGVSVAADRTKLELDLAELAGAPEAFRAR